MSAHSAARTQSGAGVQRHVNETADVTTPLIKALNALPMVEAVRIFTGSARVRGGYIHGAPEGTPDVHADVLGVSLWLETKTPTGRVSAEQTKRHEELRRAGARVEVVRSVAEGLAVVRQVMEWRAPCR